MSSKPSTSKQAPNKSPKEDTIVTRNKSNQMKRQLRNIDRSMKSITQLLKAAPRNTQKTKQTEVKIQKNIVAKNGKNIKRFKLDDITNVPLIKSLNLIPSPQPLPVTNKTPKTIKPTKKIKPIAKAEPEIEIITPKITIQKCFKQKKVTAIGKKKDYSPSIQRRESTLKTNWLKPRYEYKTVCRVDGVLRRKLYIPKRGIDQQKLKRSIPPSLSSELDVKQLVRVVDDQGLDEEDFMEILTCPSPVWWETPPDDFYIEDAILMQVAIDTRFIDEELAKARETQDNSEKVPILDVKLDKTNKDFMRKRSKLENILGIMKTNVNLPPKCKLGCKGGAKNKNIDELIEIENDAARKSNDLEVSFNRKMINNDDTNNIKCLENNRKMECEDGKDFTKSKDVLIDLNDDEINKLNETKTIEGESLIAKSEIKYVKASSVHKKAKENLRNCNDVNNMEKGEQTTVIICDEQNTEEEKHVNETIFNKEVSDEIVDITFDNEKDVLDKETESNSVNTTKISDENNEISENLATEDVSRNNVKRNVSISSDEMSFSDVPDETLYELENIIIPVKSNTQTNCEIIEITDDEDPSVDTISSPISSKSISCDSKSIKSDNLDSISDTNIKFINEESVSDDNTNITTNNDSSTDDKKEIENKNHIKSKNLKREKRKRKIMNTYKELMETMINKSTSYVLTSIKSDNSSTNKEKCHSCIKDKNQTLVVSDSDEVKYCYKCSSIFDSEDCEYCEKHVS